MKYVFAFLLISIISSSVFAQYKVGEGNVKITMSDPYPVIDGMTYLLSDKEYAFEALTLSNSGEVVIRSFDKQSLTLKLTLQSNDLLTADERFMVTLVDDNGKDLHYSLHSNHKEQERSVSFTLLDFKNSSIEMTDKKSFQMNLYSDYNFIVSENKKYLYFSYTTKLDKTSTLTSIVLDWNLNEIWKKETLFENLLKIESNYSSISNELKVIEIIKEIHDYSKPEFNKFTYVHLSSDNQIKSQLVSTEGGNKYNVSMKQFSNKKGLNICGFYTSTKEFSGTHSLFLMNLNEDGEVVSEKLISIPKDKLSLYSGSESDLKKQLKQDRSLKMISCVEDIQGNINIIGEEEHTISNSSDYHSITGNYIAIQLNPDGNINWVRILPKKIENSSNCKVQVNDDFIRIMYLDNPANLTLSENQIPKGNLSYKGHLTIYDINLIDGESTKRSLFNILEYNKQPLYQFNFNRIETISETELLIEFYAKKKQNVWIRVEL